jgi:hypothetical protein
MELKREWVHRGPLGQAWHLLQEGSWVTRCGENFVDEHIDAVLFQQQAPPHACVDCARSLTEREEKFLNGLEAGMKHRDAAESAGYRPEYASSLMGTARMREAIRSRQITIVARPMFKRWK